jgi:hypothetical protein
VLFVHKMIPYKDSTFPFDIGIGRFKIARLKEFVTLGNIREDIFAEIDFLDLVNHAHLFIAKKRTTNIYLFSKVFGS